jgi:hypothetical protein
LSAFGRSCCIQIAYFFGAFSFICPRTPLDAFDRYNGDDGLNDLISTLPDHRNFHFIATADTDFLWVRVWR